MPSKKRWSKDQWILAHELGLDEWLSLLGTGKWDRVFPNNCFPTDKHKKEYLVRIKDVDEKLLKRLARSFLNKSDNYGVSEDHFVWVIKNYGPEAFKNDDFHTEFDRRSVQKHGPQWEGITWVLDLLPENPLDAISSLRAYVQAHVAYFTDNMIYGHRDVVDMIQARYDVVARYSCFISYGGPDERFARKLCDSLTQLGVQAFFFPRHATPGKRVYRVMREAVNQYDRIILICSEASLDRPGVLNELTETLQREARDGGKDYLIPIRLDDYVFTKWAPDDAQLVQVVRDRVVADFSATLDDEGAYNTALQELVSALNRPLTGRGALTCEAQHGRSEASRAIR